MLIKVILVWSFKHLAEHGITEQLTLGLVHQKINGHTERSSDLLLAQRVRKVIVITMLKTLKIVLKPLLRSGMKNII